MATEFTLEVWSTGVAEGFGIVGDAAAAGVERRVNRNREPRIGISLSLVLLRFTDSSGSESPHNYKVCAKCIKETADRV